MTLPSTQTLHFEDLRLGLAETYRKEVKASDVVGFAELTGDRNPIHLSEHFAAKTPFGGRIAHGLYTAGLISALIGTRLPGPGAIYISQTLYFKAPVRIGDVVEARVEVVELIEAGHRAKLVCACMVRRTSKCRRAARRDAIPAIDVRTARAARLERRRRRRAWS
jgi:3-hydroxybutyryl-CoA dehydratase